MALSALASHAGGANAGIAASFLLAHAPALLAIGVLAAQKQWPRAALLLSGGLLLVGLCVFCADLVLRDYAGQRLFAMAAPTGGILLIAGWLALAISALSPPRR